MKKYYNLKEASSMYGLKERTLRQMCLTKKVKASKVGKVWYIAPQDMDGIFEAGRNR
jgi:hypothetical protein